MNKVVSERLWKFLPQYIMQALGDPATERFHKPSDLSPVALH